MAWYCLEGIDRSGKSTVAEFYKKQGFEVIHLSAPDKKYTRLGYTGPSYLDDTMELMVSKSGQNIVWDRSWYGESNIWPYVYGRDPQLTEEDIEILREIEDQNDTTRILMFDPDAKANWQRCVDNKEPLTLQQFNLARQLYSAMAHKYNFTVTSLPKFLEANNVAPKQPTKLDSDTVAPVSNNVAAAVAEIKAMAEEKMSKEQEKLEKANAINSVLKTKKLFKQTGWPYDELEGQVRQFLNTQLGDILGTAKPSTALSTEDVMIVKEFLKRLKEKQR